MKKTNPVFHYKINKSDVVYETFDGEVVIINLKNGNYYNFFKIGVEIWDLIEKRANLSEIIETIVNRYKGRQVDIAKSINDFIVKLQQEKLILSDSIIEPKSEIELSLEPKMEKLDYESPVLHKYEDMQELILLDPIHSVDETGWPSKNPEISDNE